MDNLYYYNQGRAVPDTAKRKIQGGRLNGKTDINPMWRIKMLTEMFGPCGIGWYYKSVKEWTETYDKSVSAFVKIELYVKVNGEWSMPIHGIGGSMFVEIQKSGAYVSDECYKMATTDAISVACKQLGIGADVYWDKDKTKYDAVSQQNEPASDTATDDPEMEQLRNQLKSECARTGVSLNSLRSVYGNINGIEDLTKLQLKDALKRMKKTPDKAAS